MSFIDMVKSLRSTVEECSRMLGHDMKDWAEAFASDFNSWCKGRQHEIPFLLKILLSSEDELLSCLN